MASKKPAAPRKAAAKQVKSAKTVHAVAPQGHLWTLPVAMLMLILAAGALWLAVRESSNAPEAAASAPVATAIAPEPATVHKTEKPAAPASPSAVADAGSARAASTKPVSITGCLQQAGSGFVLKNAEGASISKSRSWKSGFLKRSAPSIDLLDAGNAAHLGSHVGQRVSVSGPFADGEMRVQSLHRVAATCQ